MTPVIVIHDVTQNGLLLFINRNYQLIDRIHLFMTSSFLLSFSCNLPLKAPFKLERETLSLYYWPVANFSFENN